MKLEIEVSVAADAAIRARVQEHLRKEAVLTLFADRKIPAGKAAHELVDNRSLAIAAGRCTRFRAATARERLNANTLVYF